MLSNNIYSLCVKRSPTFNELSAAGLNYELSAVVMFLIQYNCPAYPADVPCFPVIDDRDGLRLSDTIEKKQLFALGFLGGWQLYIDNQQGWCEIVERPAPEWNEIPLPRD